MGGGTRTSIDSEINNNFAVSFFFMHYLTVEDCQISAAPAYLVLGAARGFHVTIFIEVSQLCYDCVPPEWEAFALVPAKLCAFESLVIIFSNVRGFKLTGFI